MFGYTWFYTWLCPYFSSKPNSFLSKPSIFSYFFPSKPVQRVSVAGNSQATPSLPSWHRFRKRRGIKASKFWAAWSLGSVMRRGWEMPLKQWEDMGHLIGKYGKILRKWEIWYENRGTTNYKWRFIVGESHENIGVSIAMFDYRRVYDGYILQEIHIVYPAK